jgi:hypothetical protein
LEAAEKPAEDLRVSRAQNGEVKRSRGLLEASQEGWGRTRCAGKPSQRSPSSRGCEGGPGRGPEGPRRRPGGCAGAAREARGNRVPKAAVTVYDWGMDPSHNESQARALAATRRIMAVMRLEVSADGGALTEQDRTLLEAYDSERLAGDLGIFAEWHGAMGTNPDDALAGMRCRMGKGTSE